MNAEHAVGLLSGWASEVLRASIAASVLALLILLAQWVVGGRMSARLKYGLWMLLLLRLATPAIIGVHLHFRAASPPAMPVSQVIAPAEEQLSDRISDAQSSFPVVAPSINWTHILCLVWAGGVFTLLTRVAWASIRLWPQIKRLHPLHDSTLDATIDAGMRDLHLRRRPMVLAAPDHCGPALVGFIRPRLLMPRQCLDLPRHDLRLVVLHELAHQRRGDVAVGWAMTLLQSLHWFNPLIWLAFARMRGDRELACDETVLSLEDHLGDDRGRTYGMMILNLAGVLSARPPVPGAIGIVEGTRSLHRRITMIARYDGRKSGKLWAISAALLLAAIGWVRAADAPAGAAPSATPPQGSPGAATITTVADNSHVPVSDPTNPDAAKADVETVVELSKVLPDVKFDDVPLHEAIDYLRDTLNLNLDVDWTAIEAAGLDKNGPVTVHLHNVTADKVLQEVLAAGGAAKLDYEIQDGIVVIAPADVLNRGVVTRVYDVTDLLSSSTTRPADAGINLVKAIEGAVMPDSWRDQGGTIGNMQMLDNKLIVTHTRAGQRQIVNFMNQLRHPIVSK